MFSPPSGTGPSGASVLAAGPSPLDTPSRVEFVPPAHNLWLREVLLVVGSGRDLDAAAAAVVMIEYRLRACSLVIHGILPSVVLVYRAAQKTGMLRENGGRIEVRSDLLEEIWRLNLVDCACGAHNEPGDERCWLCTRRGEFYEMLRRAPV